MGRHARAFAEYQRGLEDGLLLTVFHFPVYRLGKDPKPVNGVEFPGVDICCRAVPQIPWRGGLWRLLNYWIYRWVGQRTLHAALHRQGVPSALHVHAGDKVARLIPGLYDAFRKQQRGAVPLWYTEHWAIFNEVVFDGFGKRGWVFQRDFLRLWEKVTIATPVSLSAQRSMHA